MQGDSRNRVSEILVLSSFCFLLSFTSMEVRASKQQAGQSSTTTVPDGMPVRLSLKDALSSATNKTGDEFHLTVIEDIRVGNLIVIPVGTKAVGHVLKAESKKRLGKGGKLEAAVEFVVLGTETRINVRATAARQGKGKKGAVITESVLFAPLSPLFLTRHGKDVEIPRGTTISAYVDGDQQVPLSLVLGANQSQISSPSGQVQANGVSTSADPATGSQLAYSAPSAVTIKSDPAGAEIAIDGDFVGNTPTTIQLGAGHHNIVLKKDCYKAWQRLLAVASGGTINLDATLEKAE